MAYLITCSGSKKIPIYANEGKLENLFRHDLLGEHRINLIKLYDDVLDWSRTLPAYELYCGPRSKIYKKISPMNWHKKGSEILILSALFGWIRHTDLIPYYDLKMNEKKGDMKVPTYKFWRNLNILPEMITTNDVDLLSANYKMALSSNGTIKAVTPNGFQYSDRGDCVGYWLQTELNRI